MESNSALPKLFDALSKAQGEFPDIPKTKVNPFFNSLYADLADIRRAVQPVLSKHGLAICQIVKGDQLETLLVHKDGGSISSSIKLNLGQKIQSLGSEITYLRRYTLSAILNVFADDDDDGNEANKTNNVSAKKPNPKVKSAQSAPQEAKITEAQVRRLWAISKECDVDEEQVRDILFTLTGKERTHDLSPKEYEAVVNEIEALAVAK